MTTTDIYALIPQRDPIVMVDRLEKAEGDCAETVLTIRPDNYFIGADGLLDETGIIEHIAQSASAFAGYRALEAGASEPPVGYIGEVKKFRCFCNPRTGDTLHTRITVEAEADGITLIKGETWNAGQPVAETQMKIADNR